MLKSWLVCVLMSLGTVAWGQAAAGSAAGPGSPMQSSNATPAPAAEVPEDSVVLTITGVCPASSTAMAASKSATGTAKAAAAKKSGACVTKMTRREFEKIAAGLSPNVTPQLKRQLSTALPKFMAMSEAAKKKGLDKTDAYQQTLKVAEMQILTTQLQRSVQEEADKISPEEIDAYYKKNPEAFEQYSLDRIFIPKNRQSENESADDDSKLTDDQKKAKEAAEKSKQEMGEQDMTKLSDTMRSRAASGEDFVKLQKEAYDGAGMKMENPTINLPKVRRTGLPPAHAEVFELKQGEISKVISDNGGHYVYKVVSKEELPEDQVKDEIHNTLKNQKLKEMMDGYTNSYKVDANEAYFGPPGAPMGGRPGPPHRPMMPPGQAPAPGAGAPMQAPPPQPPPTKPN